MSLSEETSEASSEPERESLWSRITQRGVTGFAFRLALRSGISRGSH